MCTITKRARRHFVWFGAVLYAYILLISAQYGAKVKRLYSGMYKILLPVSYCTKDIGNLQKWARDNIFLCVNDNAIMYVIELH